MLSMSSLATSVMMPVILICYNRKLQLDRTKTAVIISKNLSFEKLLPQQLRLEQRQRTVSVDNVVYRAPCGWRVLLHQPFGHISNLGHEGSRSPLRFIFLLFGFLVAVFRLGQQSIFAVLGNVC